MIYFHAYFYNIPHLEVSQNLKHDFFSPRWIFYGFTLTLLFLVLAISQSR